MNVTFNLPIRGNARALRRIVQLLGIYAAVGTFAFAIRAVAHAG